jgi:hypothetical protein
MVRRIKPAFFMILVIAVFAVMFISCRIKDDSIHDLYEDVTFTRITIEAKRHIHKIEYGIKYGKQLDNFYNMHSTLKDIQRCSSYMEGAYIVSSTGKLLYQNGLEAGTLNLVIPKNYEFSRGRIYFMSEDERYYYLSIPIRSGDNAIVGYLVMCVVKSAVSNAVLDYNEHNRLQSLIIAIEIIGISLFIIRRLKLNERKKTALKLVAVLTMAVTLAVAIDSGMVIAKYYNIVDNAARQSANKMAQALQNDVDSVLAKGVPSDRIYDLNGWLARNSSDLSIVTSLTIGKNQKIAANVSQEYIKGFLARLVLQLAGLLLACVLSGIAACLIAVVAVKAYERKDVNSTTTGGIAYV